MLMLRIFNEFLLQAIILKFSSIILRGVRIWSSVSKSTLAIVHCKKHLNIAQHVYGVFAPSIYISSMFDTE